MGPLRSLRKAADRFYNIKSESKQHQFLRWSTANNWVARCEGWDLEQERDRVIRQLEEIKAMDDRQALHGKNLQEIAVSNIYVITGHTAKDGKGKIITATMSVEEARKLFESGIKAERVARGEVTEISERKHGGEIQIIEIAEQERED
jgi:hypothetical protein